MAGLLDGTFNGWTVLLMAVVLGMAFATRYAWRQRASQQRSSPVEQREAHPGYVDSWPFPPMPRRLRIAREVSDSYGGATRAPIASRRARRGA